MACHALSLLLPCCRRRLPCSWLPFESPPAFSVCMCSPPALCYKQVANLWAQAAVSASLFSNNVSYQQSFLASIIAPDAVLDVRGAGEASSASVSPPTRLTLLRRARGGAEC